MWELDYKASWAPKNWCFWNAVLEKTLESPLDCKEIQPFHPQDHQSWVFTGRTDVEAETPILWPPDVKNWLIWSRAGGEGDDRGWDGWMASLTQWTRVWVDSKSWWWAGRPGVLWFMGSQRVRHVWVTELNEGKQMLSWWQGLFTATVRADNQGFLGLRAGGMGKWGSEVVGHSGPCLGRILGREQVLTRQVWKRELSRHQERGGWQSNVKGLLCHGRYLDI